MKKSIVSAFFIAISFLSTLHVSAVPANPEPVTIVQGDGTELTIKQKGDEFYRYTTTVDDYEIEADENNVYYFVQKDAKGNKVRSSVKAKQVDKRSNEEKSFVQTLQKASGQAAVQKERRMARAKSIASAPRPQKVYPSTGTPKALVILVNFTDKSFNSGTANQDFTDLLNLDGYSANGGTGSAKDYFSDASNGVFTPQFDVVGPYTLSNNMEYYGGNVNKEDVRPREMIIEACGLADADGVDFSQYDTDNDGIVDNIFVFYAGYNEAEYGPAYSIWPHRWSMANYSTTFDGKIIWSYACTSELKGSTGTNMCGIGTFCHEFGHVLGLPDYYATTVGATHHTVSRWSIMDEGPYLNAGRTPPTYSAYDRFYLGWLTPVELKTSQNITINPLITHNEGYIISQSGDHNLNATNPSPTEFFVLENRQKAGWDAYLPNHGLLITRINYNTTDWNDNTVNNDPDAMGYDIMEADNLASSTSLAGDVFPGTATDKIRTFNPTLRSGLVINKPLSNIVENNGVINFDINTSIASITFDYMENPSKEFYTRVLSGGDVAVYMPDGPEDIYVFNPMGQLIQKISSDQKLEYVQGLEKNGVYIIQAGKNKSKVLITSKQ